MRNKHSELYLDYAQACRNYSAFLEIHRKEKQELTSLYRLGTVESLRRSAELRRSLAGRRLHIAEFSAEFKERKRELRRLSGSPR